MKWKWKIGLAVLCVVALVTVAYAATAGGPEDPLVTLSYLRNVFTGQVESMVDDAVAAGQDGLKQTVDSTLADWDARVSQAIEELPEGGGESAQFVPLTLKAGQRLALKAGGEVIVTSGSLVSNGALVDETAGSTLAAGGTLSADHLYLAGADCVLSIAAVQNTGTVREGPLRVRSGAGTGYGIVGQLPAGAAVTILDSSSSGWYRVSGGGVTGYVSSSYITLDPPVQSGSAALMVRGTYTVE